MNKRESDEDEDKDKDDDDADVEMSSPPKRRRTQYVLASSSSGDMITKPRRDSEQSNPADRVQLVRVAKETTSLLPGLLVTRPDVKTAGFLYDGKKVDPLVQSYCPKLPKTKVRVTNCDTIDAALQLSRRPAEKPICVLNMANAQHAGGGFKKGALAQEEVLCYRSSLSFTLKLRHYPIPDEASIYSPSVLVIRESLAKGHTLLDCRDPSQLPVISVVSAAAIYKPDTKMVVRHPPAISGKVYARADDRKLMQEKMRIILRTAIKNKHRKIVLGAFGCGAFENPLEGVCDLWASVLKEPEFSGGWWEEVVFAVLSRPGEPNFPVFHKILDGLEV